MVNIDYKTAISKCSELFSSINVAKQTINKYDMLLQKGEFVDYIYLIKNGLLGITHTKKKQLNLCGCFYTDDVIVTTSFLTRCPSEFDLTALKKCVVYKIHRQHLNNDIQTYLSVNRISMNIMEKFLYYYSLINDSNKKRFELICANENPEIFDVPNGILCTFFGFSRRTLYELKKKHFNS